MMKYDTDQVSSLSHKCDWKRHLKMTRPDLQICSAFYQVLAQDNEKLSVHRAMI